MPVLTINGRPVTVDDSFLSLPREEQDATVEEIAKSLPAQKPSGAYEGLVHGVKELAHGNAETAKQFAGVGDGINFKPDNYVPANLTNGSANPLNWNWSQAGQKIAEAAPGLSQDVLAGTAAKVLLGRRFGPAGALAGAALSAWLRSAGDTAKETAAVRTGDANAEPTTADKIKGGSIAAASSAIGALTPTRFVPGLNKVTAVGAQGALDAAKKYLATTAIGAGSSAASDAVNQLGTHGTYDPAQGIEAAAGGGLTAGTLAAPRGVADAVGSARLGKFGGENLEASKAYATRLQDAGYDLGKSKNDYQAHETVKKDIGNELRDAAASVRKQTALSPEVDNALQRAQSGSPLTEQDINLIGQGAASAPDGANVAHLSRQLHVAQMAQERGSYDPSGGWSGGASGLMDKNLGWLLNPTRLVGGTVATAMGMHLLGTSNPMFAGSLAAGYLGARGVDSLAGIRSPAKTFAERFAQGPAQLRLPPTAPQGPAAPPPDLTQGPWGTRPPGPSVPQVAPPAPPQLDANAVHNDLRGMLLMAAARRKVAEQAAAANAPQPLDANALNEQIKGALLMASARRKVEGQQQAEALAQDSPVIAENGGLGNLSNPAFGKRANELLSAARANAKLTAQPEEEPPAPAPAGPVFNPLALSMLKQKLKQPLEAPASAPPTAPPRPAKIKKQDGSVSVEPAAPAVDPWDSVGSYDPAALQNFVFKGKSAPIIAKESTDAKLPAGVVPELNRTSYYNRTLQTRTARNNVVVELTKQYPEASAVLQEMLDHLHEPGNSDKAHSMRIVKHYAGLLSGAAGKAVRDTFARQDVQDVIWPPSEKKKK